MKRSSKTIQHLTCMVLMASWLVHVLGSPVLADTADDLKKALAPMVGPRDAVMISNPAGNPLVEIHVNQPLVPASILKVLTALAAITIMGPEYRYATEFYSDDQENLVIKGFGDPLLISERLDAICAMLSAELSTVKDLILDNTYFSRQIVIPGRGVSTEPYDAPNGALCVNFNTVAFRHQDGQWLSDEPQTPLLPAVIPKIIASGLSSGRITLAADSAEALQYTGELFRFFLVKNGMAVKGTISAGAVELKKHRLVWRYQSEADLRQVVAKLLEFSNNFIANQLLLTMGAHVHGPPATVQKGIRILQTFYRQQLGIQGGTVAEASGISRQNRVSARDMMVVLEHFAPHYELMRKSGRQHYKTGHLKGVRSRAGYLASRRGGHYRFVVIINTPGKSTNQTMQLIERNLK